MLVMTFVSNKQGMLVDICKRGMEGNRTVIKVWKGVTVYSSHTQGVSTVLVMTEIVDRTIICQLQTLVKSQVIVS
jgi:hypothetical protein